jgi:myosin heavy subunit
MQKMSLQKQSDVIRLYLSGLSYSEISSKAGVAKGTVANIITELKAGHILDVQESHEQMELLREIAIDLHNLKLTPGQALTGVAIISHLRELGVEPADIQRWAAMCRQLAADPNQIPSVVSSAMALEEIRQRTGLSPEALEDKVKVLQKEETNLQSRIESLKKTERQLAELEKHRNEVAKEVSQIKQRLESLQKEVKEKKKRDVQLSSQTQDLEKRVHQADEQLAVARAELKNLAEMGLSSNDLAGLVHRLAAIAQRQSIEPAALRARLLAELEKLEQGLGLETLIQTRQQDLAKAAEAVTKTNGERVRLQAAVDVLRKEEAALKSSISQEQQVAKKNIQDISKMVSQGVEDLQKKLNTGVIEVIHNIEKLRDNALELGQELGRVEEIIKANQWLHTLLALVKGDVEVNALDVKTVLNIILVCFKRWTQRKSSQTYLTIGLTNCLDLFIKELERWKISTSIVKN